MSHRFTESNVDDAPAWVAASLIVRRWEAMKQDVLVHKWYESERAGHDIGWDRAYVDWNLRVAGQFERRHSRRG